tara:strand:- start:213 stop:464 length:252 start_codon:yes stop_codon:yes gene_type:complete
LAKEETEQERGGGEDGRTTHRFGEGIREFRVATGVRHHRIERPTQQFVFDGPEHQTDDIVNMDAGHPLATVTELPSQSGSKNR